MVDLIGLEISWLTELTWPSRLGSYGRVLGRSRFLGESSLPLWDAKGQLWALGVVLGPVGFLGFGAGPWEAHPIHQDRQNPMQAFSLSA